MAVDFNDYWLEQLPFFEVSAVIPMPAGGFDRSEVHRIVAPDAEVARTAVLAKYPEAVDVTVHHFETVPVYKKKPAPKASKTAKEES